MLTTDATILAALIAGVASLLAVVINVVSAYWTRSQERREKREAYIREKQDRDAEIIISELSRFSQKFSDATTNDIRKQNYFTDSEIGRRHELILREEHNPTVVQQQHDWLLTETRKFNERVPRINEDLEALRESVHSWLYHDVRRLNLWFTDSERLNAELAGLLRRFGGICNDLGYNFFNFRTFTYELENSLGTKTGLITEGLVAEVKELQNAISKVMSEWATLNSDIASFQKTLTMRFHQPGTSVDGRSKDGPLVSFARQIEKGVRWLLR